MNAFSYLLKARSRYTDQHSDDEFFDALVQIMIDQSIINQDTLLALEETIYDIDKSSGVLLDLIGEIVGQDRIIDGGGEFFGFKEDPSALGFGTLADPEVGGYFYSLLGSSNVTVTIANDVLYRRMIKARIIYNNNLATPETLVRILRILSNSPTARFTEDGVGNIMIEVESDDQAILTYFLSIRLTDKNILPIPLGVAVGITITGT